MQKSIKKLMHLGIGFWKDLDGFWEPNGAMLAPKSIKNRCDLRTKNNGFSLRKTIIFKVRGVQVESKNRSKIDQKRSSTWEGILALIFERFWWILGGKMKPSWHQNP